MLALVSRPPVKAPSARPARSKSLMVSPRSRMIWPTRPSPGSSRCRRVKSMRYSREPEMAPSAPAPPYVTSNRAEASDRNVSRSSTGSPSSSQITRNGTGKPKSRTSSASSPAAASASSCSSTMPAMRGRSRSRRRIVNSGVSSLRSRVWSGGSVKPRPPMSPEVGVAALARRSGRMSLLNAVACERTSRASGSPVTSQTSMPRNEVSRSTGDRSPQGAQPWRRVEAVPAERPDQPVRDPVHLREVDRPDPAHDPLADHRLEFPR